MFQVGPFTFHLYGLCIGAAIWVSLWLIEARAQRAHIHFAELWPLIIWMFIGAVAGARIHHLITDFSLYQDRWIDMLKIWQGGLSIIGAVIGAGIFALVWLKLHPHFKISFWTIADLSVFGLPFGQALGRLGNFFNQELYGLPTQLPWGIYIDPTHRVAPYLHAQFFHPLFAYEMIFTVTFGIALWTYDRYIGSKKTMLGTGQYFLLYAFYYSFIRFLLDFIRIDKSMFFYTGLGKNQVFLLIVMVILVTFLIKKKAQCTTT